MAIFQDIQLTNPQGDLKISHGDFIIAPSDEQHIFDIINDNPGEWQQFPNIGVGLNQYINGSNLSILAQNIKIQLQSDGYSVGNIQIALNQSTSQLNVNPNASRL